MNTAKTTLLIAGASGRLGGLIAGHLLDQDGAVVRLLVRESAQADPDRPGNSMDSSREERASSPVT